ncbi:MAG: TlyA family RNA methyltransferase, partial [Victivallales bacterium]|nr:TlyA family RNA methyltransferase [Victivallales bacterium]
MARIRADQRCVAQGLAESRTAAQRLIVAGQILLPDNSPVRKAGQLVEEDVPLKALSQLPYVSRGAYKLLAAIEAYPHNFTDKVALDVGASTGGFTDVLLKQGSKRVYAVDVGTDQLHPSLKNDPRVISLEHTNARQLSSELIPEAIDVLVADVSFISLTKVLPACARLLNDVSCWIAVLIKPQFEAEPNEVGKNGVVRDETVRERCIQKITVYCQQNLGWTLSGTIPSPILGPQG